MRKGTSLYSGLLNGISLRDAIAAHQLFKVNPDGSGFDKTLIMVSERYELLLLASAMAEFIINNNIEGSFRSYLFVED